MHKTPLLLLFLVLLTCLRSAAQSPAPAREALLVMDMQDAILSNFGDVKDLTGRVAGAIAYARTKGIPVIYLRAGFRKGAPEISANNKLFAANRAKFAAANPEQFFKVAAGVAPAATDIIVDRRRISAFAGSDLAIVLRAQNIQHLVLTGVATSGVVLSTVRAAADEDYQLTVLSDGCADTDPEVQRVLMTKVFPKQAEVLTIQEWMAATGK